MKRIISAIMMVILTSAAMAQGAYAEYKLSSAQGMNGSMKMYFQDGNSRSEMNMQMPQMPGGGMNFTSLYLKAHSDKFYMLNEKNKTYSEMEMTKSDGNTVSKEDDYEVTLVGKEKVNGYNATHVKIKHKGGTTEMDMWTSMDVANYAHYQNMRSKYTSAGLYKALKDKGADGVLVRMIVGEHGRDIQMDLVKAESRSVEASLFSLAGYTKSEGPAAGPGGAAQEMVERMKNMTPEERRKFIEEMKKAHGAGQ